MLGQLEPREVLVALVEMLMVGLKMVSREARLLMSLLEGLLLPLRILVVGFQQMVSLGLMVLSLVSLLEGLLLQLWFLVVGIFPSMSLGPMVLPLVGMLEGLQQLWLRRNMDRMPQRSPPPAAPMIRSRGVETETEIAVAGGDQGRDLHHEPAV